MKFSSCQRIYANISLIDNIIIKLSDQYNHYLKTVLRLKKGNSFRIFNDRDGEFHAEITNIFKNDLEIKIGKKLRNFVTEPEITLGLCLIKADKMMDAINMAVQLGVTEIVPLISARSQVRNINEQRFLKCIIEATEQSERLRPPFLKPPISLGEYYNEVEDDDLIIYANEHEKSCQTVKLISKLLFKKISLIIGPEGGFTETEISKLASRANAISISLGDNILRAETAVAAALAQIKLIRC